MKATYLASSLIALSLLLPASSGVVRIEAAQHGGAQHMSHSASTLPGAVRRATARFLDVDDAIAAGYVQFQGCVSGQNLGAMGVHYVNPALFDDRLEVDQPEALDVVERSTNRLPCHAVGRRQLPFGREPGADCVRAVPNGAHQILGESAVAGDPSRHRSSRALARSAAIGT